MTQPDQNTNNIHKLELAQQKTVSEVEYVKKEQTELKDSVKKISEDVTTIREILVRLETKIEQITILKLASQQMGKHPKSVVLVIGAVLTYLFGPEAITSVSEWAEMLMPGSE